MAAGVVTESAVTTASEWPRVTWLMPVLNGMPYLRELLDSLVAQTYPNHEITVRIVCQAANISGVTPGFGSHAPDAISEIG
jgi:cellulose synthase/poly-beta-1,6-N-acetylglucosamine synthase-like glycosyltransferase